MVSVVKVDVKTVVVNNNRFFHLSHWLFILYVYDIIVS